MKITEIIGIDVSKRTLDFHFYNNNLSFKTSNTPEGFIQMLQTSKDILNDSMQDVLFCFEDTGRYSKPLSVFLYDSGFKFKIINALDLKRSLGLVRGKTDKTDARLIARYAWEKRDEIIPSVLPSPITDQLKSLLTLREKLIKHRTSYKNGIKDLQDCYIDGEYDFIRGVHKKMINQLNQEILQVEEQIIEIISMHHELKENYKLLLSIKGIGKVLAIYLIVLTENFTRFSNPRKFACYAGIAPFPYSSGTSVRGKTKLNSCANKQIKSLLNMASMSVIQLKGEYKKYYLRRCNEGKNKMSTLNIIRNKLVFRAFAVVKRGTPYVDLSTFAA
jgi:transposase